MTSMHPGIRAMLAARLVDGQTMGDRIMDELMEGDADADDLAEELGVSRKSIENAIRPLLALRLVEVAGLIPRLSASGRRKRIYKMKHTSRTSP